MSFREFTKGLYKENPTFRIMLGMCPTLAVTTSLINGIGMGLATAAVLVCSNAMISLIGGIVPNKIRIPVYVVVIAAFVTITDLSLAAYVPDLHKSLGLFIPGRGLRQQARRGRLHPRRPGHGPGFHPVLERNRKHP